MSLPNRLRVALFSAVGWIAAGAWAGSQGTPGPRPGLTAHETQEAVRVARQAMIELRKKTEGATRPDVDRREYIVGVELLSTKEPDNAPGQPEVKAKTEPRETPPAKEGGKAAPKLPPRKSGPLALVTSYRYFDDITAFATVDLATGRIVNLEAAQHLRTPLSDEEFEDAKALAKERSEEVKALYQKFGARLSVYPQFSQFTVKDDPRIHRVIHLTYRVGTKDLSYPRPLIDLTTRQVSTPAAEDFPQPSRPR
jgi:hypothetical protein